MELYDQAYSQLMKNGNFDKLFIDLKEYLRSKLTLMKINDFEYYSCGHDGHYPSDPGWEPFMNYEAYFQGKGYDDLLFRELLEERMGIKLICECQIITDLESVKMARLRSFGFDLWNPEMAQDSEDL